MGAIKRVVSTSFWDDDKVIECFTPEDKYFMLYLLTNPHTTQLGIYQVSVKQMAWELGYSTDSVKALIERFCNVHKVLEYSKSTSEIAILNYLCYAVVKGGKPVLDCLERDLKQVKNKELFIKVINNIKDRQDLLDTVNIFINKYIKEYNINNNIYLSNDKENDNDNDKENDNDNDNDNDSTPHVTYHDTYPVRPTIRTPYVKDKIDRKDNLINSNYLSLLKNNIKVVRDVSDWNDLDIDTKNEIFSLLNNVKNINDNEIVELRCKLEVLVNDLVFNNENNNYDD